MFWEVKFVNFFQMLVFFKNEYGYELCTYVKMEI